MDTDEFVDMMQISLTEASEIGDVDNPQVSAMKNEKVGNKYLFAKEKVHKDGTPFLHARLIEYGDAGEELYLECSYDNVRKAKLVQNFRDLYKLDKEDDEVLSVVSSILPSTRLLIKHVPMSIADIYGKYVRNEIDLEPEFQRNLVWTPKLKGMLMDSILRGLDINKIYVVETIEDGISKWLVLDGKQRLSAIFEYREGGFAFRKRFIEIQCEPVKGILNNFWKDLSSELIDTFFEYELQVAKVHGSKKEIIELFYRLNKHGIKMNRAEANSAYNAGKFLKSITKLRERYNSYLLDQEVLSDRDVNRKLDEEYFVILYGLTKDGPVQGKTKLNAYYTFDKIDINVQKELENCFRFMKKIIVLDTIFNTKGNFEVLYLAILNLIRAGFAFADDTTEKTNEFLKGFSEEFLEYKLNGVVSTKYDKIDLYFKATKSGWDSKRSRETKYLYLYDLIAELGVFKDSKRVLTRDERLLEHLKNKGVCEDCNKLKRLREVTPHHHPERHVDGGETVPENTRMVCDECHKKYQ